MLEMMRKYSHIFCMLIVLAYLTFSFEGHCDVIMSKKPGFNIKIAAYIL